MPKIGPSSNEVREAVLEEEDVSETDLELAQVTNIFVVETYGTLCYERNIIKQPDGTYPPLEKLKKSSPREVKEEMEADDYVYAYSVEYNPEVILQMNGEDNQQFYARFLRASQGWSSKNNLVHALYGMTDDLGQISPDRSVSVAIDPSKTGGKIYTIYDGSICGSKRRFYSGTPTDSKKWEDSQTEPIESYENINGYIQYNREVSERYKRGVPMNILYWEESEIKSLLLPSDYGEFKVCIETPLGNTAFKIREYEEVAELMGVKTSKGFRGSTVYIRPHRRKFYDDITSESVNQSCRSFDSNESEGLRDRIRKWLFGGTQGYTVGYSEDKMWEMAVEDPRKRDGVVHRILSRARSGKFELQKKSSGIKDTIDIIKGETSV